MRECSFPTDLNKTSCGAWAAVCERKKINFKSFRIELAQVSPFHFLGASNTPESGSDACRPRELSGERCCQFHSGKTRIEMPRFCAYSPNAWTTSWFWWFRRTPSTSMSSLSRIVRAAPGAAWSRRAGKKFRRRTNISPGRRALRKLPDHWPIEQLRHEASTWRARSRWRPASPLCDGTTCGCRRWQQPRCGRSKSCIGTCRARGPSSDVWPAPCPCRQWSDNKRIGDGPLRSCCGASNGRQKSSFWMWRRRTTCPCTWRKPRGSFDAASCAPRRRASRRRLRSTTGGV